MQMHTRPNGALIVSCTSRVSDWLLLLGAALCAVPALRGAMHGRFDLHEATPLIGSAFFLLAFLVSYERTRFEFDPGSALVRWCRTRMFSLQEGSLPFDRVEAIVLQTSIAGTATSPSYRLALISARGDLPITSAYTSGMRDEYESIAARIRTLLNRSSPMPPRSPETAGRTHPCR